MTRDGVMSVDVSPGSIWHSGGHRCVLVCWVRHGWVGFWDGPKIEHATGQTANGRTTMTEFVAALLRDRAELWGSRAVAGA